MHRWRLGAASVRLRSNAPGAEDVAWPTSTSTRLLAIGVLLSTAATDAVYVLFSSAVAARRRMAAASWSSIWYLLSAFAVISYTHRLCCNRLVAGGIRIDDLDSFATGAGTSRRHHLRLRAANSLLCGRRCPEHPRNSPSR